MLQNIYINNYRCLENFSVSFAELSSALILGQNGSGKTNFFDAVHVFQRIAWGETSLKSLITEKDFPFDDTNRVITFDIEAKLEVRRFRYLLEIEFPEGFYQPRVHKEVLSCDEKTLFSREGGKTTLHQAAEFVLDWHHVGLPLIQARSVKDPLAQFRRWLGNICVIGVCPQSFRSISTGEDVTLERNAANLLNWSRKLLSDSPSLYSHVEQFLKRVMPDFAVFRFDAVGKNEKELFFEFNSEGGAITGHEFSQLSDGEKVFFLAACISAAFQAGKPITCFWDEPDNFIAINELDQMIMACRKASENSQDAAQLIISSHNPQVVSDFSRHNTLVFARAGHTHPTRVSWLADKTYPSPTLIEAFENGELF